MPLPFPWFGQIIAPILKPTVRFLAGLLAIPMLRLVRRKLRPNSTWDDEFERDVEQWTRASLLLLLATKNVEEQISLWISQKELNFDLDSNWWFAAGRLLLAIGVIESMPDQQLFSIIHPGPRPPRWIRGIGLWGNISKQAWPLLRGVLCMHLSRSSPVFAILAVIFSGVNGWIFYFLAITQYLIIGLVTSRDKALDVLSRFDQEIARQREALEEEFRRSHSDSDETPSLDVERLPVLNQGTENGEAGPAKTGTGASTLAATDHSHQASG